MKTSDTGSIRVDLLRRAHCTPQMPRAAERVRLGLGRVETANEAGECCFCGKLKPSASAHPSQCSAAAEKISLASTGANTGWRDVAQPGGEARRDPFEARAIEPETVLTWAINWARRRIFRPTAGAAQLDRETVSEVGRRRDRVARAPPFFIAPNDAVRCPIARSARPGCTGRHGVGETRPSWELGAAARHLGNRPDLVAYNRAEVGRLGRADGNRPARKLSRRDPGNAPGERSADLAVFAPDRGEQCRRRRNPSRWPRRC